MFRLAVLVSSLCFFALLTPRSQALDARQVFESIAPSTVQIQSIDSAGTGIVLTETGLILTNYHVVAGELDLKVRARIRFGNKVALTELDEVTITKIHPKYDLALLQVKLPQGGTAIPARIIPRQTPVPPGSKCFVIGNPGGADGQTLDLSITEGIVSSTSRKLEGLEYAQVSAAINPGNSGGPVCDDMGRVFGIVTWKMSQAEGLGFAIPTQQVTLTDFVDKKTRQPDMAMIKQAEEAASKLLKIAKFGDPNERVEALRMCAMYYRATLNEAPNDKAPYLNLAMVLEELGEKAYAKKYLEVALKAFPNDARVCHRYGALVLNGRDTDKTLADQCIEIWMRGLTKDPDKIEASFCADDIAVCLFNQKNFLGAAYMLRWSEMLRKDPPKGVQFTIREDAWATISNALPAAAVESIRTKETGFTKEEFMAVAAGRPLAANGSAKPTPGTGNTPASGTGTTPAPGTGNVPAKGAVSVPNITPAQMELLAKNAAAKFTPTMVTVTEEGLECPLPDTPSQVLLANNGWQLVLHFPELSKCGVLNLATGKIDGFIDVPDRQCLFAAGGQVLTIYSQTSQTFWLYDLATLKQVATSKSPVSGKISYIGMGLLNPTRVFVIYRRKDNSPALPGLLKIPDFSVINLANPSGQPNEWEMSGTGHNEEGVMDVAGTYAALSRPKSTYGLARYQISESAGFDLKSVGGGVGVPAFVHPGNLILGRDSAFNTSDLSLVPYANVPDRFHSHNFGPVIGYPGIVDIRSFSPSGEYRIRVSSVPDLAVLLTQTLPAKKANNVLVSGIKIFASAYADRTIILPEGKKFLTLFPLGLKGGAAAGIVAEPGKHFERKVKVPEGAKVVVQSGPTGLRYNAGSTSIIWDVPATIEKKQVVQVILLVTESDSKTSYVVEKITIP